MLFASLAWVALLAWSATTAPPTPGGGAWWLLAGVEAAAALVCHGEDARSFAGPARPVVVCARCCGLYLGAVAGAWYAWRRRPRRLQRATDADLAFAARRALLWSAGPTLATVALEWAGLWDPGNAVRAAAALPLGATVAWLATTVAGRWRGNGLPAAGRVN